MYPPFLRSVAEDIKTRFGNDLSDIAIIFNNKRPISYLKKHLAEVYGKAIWSPQFFTIQEFVSLSSNYEDVSALTQFFYLFEIHNTLLEQEGLPTETLEDFYPIAEIILSDFGQLDYDLVHIDHIFMELYDNSRIDLEFQYLSKEQQDFIRQFWQSFTIAGHTGIQQRFLNLWRRLPVLYRKFKDKLADENQSNYPTLYRNLAEGKIDNPAFLSPFKKLLFVGFNALNKAEATLFSQWQEEGRALFYFDADRHYLDDPQQEAGLFIRRNIQQTGLQNALATCRNTIGTRTDVVNLYAATGKVSQTKLLYDILEQHEEPGKTSAILLADEGLLVPLLQSLPTSYKNNANEQVPLKVNITTGFPLTQSPIYGILDLWMRVQETISHGRKHKIPFKDIETFLNNPLTKVPTEDKIKNQQLIAEKQQYEVDLSSIHIENSALPNFFAPLRDSTAVIPALIQLLDELLLSSAGDSHIKQIDNNLLIETKKVLNQLDLGFSRIPPLTMLFQIGLIRKAIAPVNSAIEGDPLEGLQIMGLLESRCLNFDNVYILGANEGILPKTSSSITFLPNNLRRAYGLPILENQDALSAYLFYRHFQFSTQIHLFYNGIVDENSSGEESRFIRQLEFESSFKFIKKQQQQPIQFAGAVAPVSIPKTGKVWEKMIHDFVTSGKKISATALTMYLQSPLQFFLRHIAEIKEPPSISQEFEMNRLGTVIHEVMEKLLTPYKGINSFTATAELQHKMPEIAQLVVQEIGLQYATTYNSLQDLNSLQRIMHKIATAYITMYLQYDIDNYKAFKIIELENSKDYVLPFPIQIEGTTQSINLYGIIDRVDEVITDDGQVKTRIVDYKTGGDSVIFTHMDKVFAPNTENKALVQTLFYAYVYEQVSGRKALEPHLYVARRMREDGTLFGSKGTVLTDVYLQEQKNAFVEFLRNTLEEIFNPAIPFVHHPDANIYDSDPYTLFYG